MPGSGQTRPLERCPLQPDRVNVRGRRSGGGQTENPDPSDLRRLLRARRERPPESGHRADISGRLKRAKTGCEQS